MPNTPIGTRIWPDADAAGLLLHADDLADHVGHGGELLAAERDGFQVFGAKLEPVQQRPGQPAGASAVQVALVGRLQAGQVVPQQVRPDPRSALFLIAAGARAISAEAVFALRPMACMSVASSLPAALAGVMSLGEVDAFMSRILPAPKSRRAALAPHRVQSVGRSRRLRRAAQGADRSQGRGLGKACNAAMRVEGQREPAVCARRGASFWGEHPGAPSCPRSSPPARRATSSPGQRDRRWRFHRPGAGGTGRRTAPARRPGPA